MKQFVLKYSNISGKQDFVEFGSKHWSAMDGHFESKGTSYYALYAQFLKKAVLSVLTCRFSL